MSDRIAEISETVHDETRLAELRRYQITTRAKLVLANMDRHEILGEINALKLDRAQLAEFYLEQATDAQLSDMLKHWSE